MRLAVRKYVAVEDMVTTEMEGEACFAYMGRENELDQYLDQVEVGEPGGEWTVFDVPAPGADDG